jgi:Ni/Fe-hydrogenase subunit HybB-like protein
LFGQCEGRDLWQTPLLLPTLLAQAVTAGGATYAIMDLFLAVPEPRAVRWVLLGGVVATAALVSMELTSKGSRHVELAVHEMTHGAYAKQFWFSMLIGLVVPAVIVIVELATNSNSAISLAIAGVLSLIGMFAYEDSFVRAGQSVPLS